MPKPVRTDRRRSAPEPELPPIPPDAELGRVVRAHGLWYEIQLEHRNQAFLATLRGFLKRHRKRTDIVAVGDLVWITDVGEGEAVIERVEPRTSTLSRLARNTRDVEQVIIANPDQVLFVFASHEPEPHRRMLDRFLILAELQHLPALIGISKLDLDDGSSTPTAQERFADYEPVYPVFYFSSATGQGLNGIHQSIRNKVTVIAGPSGVGKSSLLNVLDPDNMREVGNISEATGKGKHTTIGARLHRIDTHTWLGDTPGIRALAMRQVPGAALPECFPEFRPYLGTCGYMDCTHVHEPDCAVLSAVEAGNIARERYDSYVALRTSDELDSSAG